MRHGGEYRGEAWRALERTALATGARENTEPEDDSLVRSISLKVEARGRSGMLAANVVTVLKGRGIAVAQDPTELRELLGTLSGDAALADAVASDVVLERRSLRRAMRSRGPAAAGPGGARR